MKPGRARIIIVDDHPVVRERLTELIAEEHDLAVCGQAEDASQAVALIGSTNPQVAVVDLGLKNSSGLDLIKQIRSDFGGVTVLVLSMFDETIWAERSIQAGARGYVNKQEASKTIVMAIRSVLAGETYLSPALALRLANRLSRPQPGEAGIESLTDREVQVLGLIGRGFNSRQIAEAMGIDISTVDTYRARIKEKLNLSDAAAVLQYAIAWVHTGPT